MREGLTSSAPFPYISATEYFNPHDVSGILSISMHFCYLRILNELILLLYACNNCIPILTSA